MLLRITGSFTLFARSEERVIERLSDDRVSANDAILTLMHHGNYSPPTTLRWPALSSLRGKRAKNLKSDFHGLNLTTFQPFNKKTYFYSNLKALELVKSLIDFVIHIDKHLAAIINQYHGLTYLILFAIIFAETGFVVTPFLPGDSLLFAAAALIAGGATGLNIYLLAVILIAAAFLGNTTNYWLGHFIGPKVFKEKNKILKMSYYVQTKTFFDKHGGKAVIFSRFMPIIRTIAPFVAGVGRMPFGRYSLYNIVGGTAWIVVFLVAGYELGTVPFFQKNFALVGVVIILISIVPPIIAAIKGGGKKKPVS